MSNNKKHNPNNRFSPLEDEVPELILKRKKEALEASEVKEKFIENIKEAIIERQKEMDFILSKIMGSDGKKGFADLFITKYANEFKDKNGEIDHNKLSERLTESLTNENSIRNKIENDIHANQQNKDRIKDIIGHNITQLIASSIMFKIANPDITPEEMRSEINKIYRHDDVYFDFGINFKSFANGYNKIIDIKKSSNDNNTFFKSLENVLASVVAAASFLPSATAQGQGGIKQTTTQSTAAQITAITTNLATTLNQTTIPAITTAITTAQITTAQITTIATNLATTTDPAITTAITTAITKGNTKELTTILSTLSKEKFDTVMNIITSELTTEQATILNSTLNSTLSSTLYTQSNTTDLVNSTYPFINSTKELYQNPKIEDNNNVGLGAGLGAAAVVVVGVVGFAAVAYLLEKFYGNTKINNIAVENNTKYLSNMQLAERIDESHQEFSSYDEQKILFDNKITALIEGLEKERKTPKYINNQITDKTIIPYNKKIEENLIFLKNLKEEFSRFNEGGDYNKKNSINYKSLNDILGTCRKTNSPTNSNVTFSQDDSVINLGPVSENEQVSKNEQVDNFKKLILLGVKQEGAIEVPLQFFNKGYNNTTHPINWINAQEISSPVSNRSSSPRLPSQLSNVDNIESLILPVSGSLTEHPKVTEINAQEISSPRSPSPVSNRSPSQVPNFDPESLISLVSESSILSRRSRSLGAYSEVIVNETDSSKKQNRGAESTVEVTGNVKKLPILKKLPIPSLWNQSINLNRYAVYCSGGKYFRTNQPASSTTGLKVTEKDTKLSLEQELVPNANAWGINKVTKQNNKKIYTKFSREQKLAPNNEVQKNGNTGFMTKRSNNGDPFGKSNNKNTFGDTRIASQGSYFLDL